jgi:Xaa-Pro aminopeptidase
MDHPAATLDAWLAEAGVDGYLIDADGTDPAQRYLSGFDAPDPYLTLYTPEELVVLVSPLEAARARRTSAATEVVVTSELGADRLRARYGRATAQAVIKGAICRQHAVGHVAVPPSTPVRTVRQLRGRGVRVTVATEDPLAELRAVKQPQERAAITATQAATEDAFAAAVDLLRACDIDAAGQLRHEGEPLTSERVREEVAMTLYAAECRPGPVICAGGTQAADPHDRGSGPLPAEAPIILDIFPAAVASGYHADMTRTVSVGDPGARCREWYADVAAAKAAGVEAIATDVTGDAVHEVVSGVLADAGHPTLDTDPATATGFIHATGHGVGLAVHEDPRLAPGAGPLARGAVVTVEPGLYDPAVGGIRLEDLVVVTDDGAEVLTDAPETFVL